MACFDVYKTENNAFKAKSCRNRHFIPTVSWMEAAAVFTLVDYACLIFI